MIATHRSKKELPKLAPRSPLTIEDITITEKINNELHGKIKHNEYEIKESKIKLSGEDVTQEFDQSTSVIPYSGGRDLELFKQYKVDKAKPGFTLKPLSKVEMHLPSGS